MIFEFPSPASKPAILVAIIRSLSIIAGFRDATSPSAFSHHSSLLCRYYSH